MGTDQLYIVTSTSTSGAVAVPVKPTPAGSDVPVQIHIVDLNAVGTAAGAKAIEAAVYGYIRSIRALGRTEINTLEIARALKLRIGDVQNTLAALQNKGVKTLP